MRLSPLERVDIFELIYFSKLYHALGRETRCMFIFYDIQFFFLARVQASEPYLQSLIFKKQKRRMYHYTLLFRSNNVQVIF